MSEFVGVKSGLELLVERHLYKRRPSEILKREAFIFHKIAVPALNFALRDPEPLVDVTMQGFGLRLKDRDPLLLGHLEWLLEAGVVFEPIAVEDEHLSNFPEFRYVI